MSRFRWRSVAVLIVLAVTAVACGDDKEPAKSGSSTPDAATPGAFIDPEKDCTGYKPTQGITGDTIKVGTVTPLTGNFNIYAKLTTGIQTYFTYMNDQGGITAGDGKKYKLELVTEDDAYDPSATPTRVRKLVEQDGVFAMVGQVGTANALAVRNYMNDPANCVPSISLATGSTEWGKADAYPWYIGGLPSYAAEAHTYLQFLKEKQPGSKIAVLYQDDDFGKAYLATIQKEAPELGFTVVDKASFDPRGGGGPEGAVTQLAGSGADAFFLGIGGVPCPTALSKMPADWKPLIYVNITCSGKLAMSLAGGKDEGVYSTQATYDPSNPEDKAVPAVKTYLDAGTKQGIPLGDLENGIVSTGWNFGAIFGAGVQRAKAITRADVMNALFDLKDAKDVGLIRADVPVNTNGATDPWIIEGLRIIHRQGGQWVGEGPTAVFDGKSNSFAVE